MKDAEARLGGPINLWHSVRRPGEKGYFELQGMLLPEALPQRDRDQVPHRDAPGPGDVDPVAGRLLLSTTDWALPGPVPFTFRRFYSSSMAWRAGALGLGWSHCLEQSVWVQDGWILYRTEDGREVGVPLPGGRLGIGASVHHPNAGVRILSIASDAYEVQLAGGARLGFTVAEESSHLGPARARLTRIRGVDGSALEVHYDTHGRLARLQLASGQHAHFEHDPRGRLTRVFVPTRDGSDRVLAARYEIDASGQLREAVDAIGRGTKYRYQGQLLTQQTSPSGLVRRFRYDGVGARGRCVAEEWGEEEREREYFFSAEERVVGVGDANGGSFSARANRAYLVDRVLDYFANETTRTYDETTGMLASQTTSDGETTFLYDADYHLADVSAPDQGSVALEHDEAGRLTRWTDADGSAAKWSWDPLGRLTAAIDRTGSSVIYDYEGEGALVGLLSPGEARLTLERDPRTGSVASIQSPAGTRYAQHDALSRVVLTRDELGHETTVRYDPTGRVAEVEQAGLATRFESDWEGRVTSVRRPGFALTLERDGFGRLMHVDDGGAGPRLHRDAEGRVTMVESEALDFWELIRDAAGRVQEERGFGDRTLHWQRDHNGLVTRAIGPIRRTDVKRDAAGRPTELRHSDATFQRYRWTKAGNLRRAQDADHVVRFARDGEGRVVEEKTDAHWVKSEYDTQGRRVALDSSLGLRVRIGRDARSGMITLDAADGDRRLQLTIERDACGRESRRMLPGGLSMRWERDGLGRPTQRTVSFGEQPLATLEFQWASEARLVRVADSQRGVREHRHDARGRLSRVGPLVRALDEVGRVFLDESRHGQRYTAGGMLLESQGIEYAYDAEGRRTSKTTPLGDVTRYVWDGAGRLVAVWLSDTRRVAFDYDALGRRIVRRLEDKVEIEGLDEPVWEPQRETRFVWDGLELLHEVEGDRVTTWLWEEGKLVGTLQTEGGYAVLTDPLGVPTELTDDGGNLAWRGSIGMFGMAELDAEHARCPWRLPGHWADPDTGLQHTWLRVYDPETGAYLTPSPLGVVGGANLYATVDDPLSQPSPLGLGRGYAVMAGELRGERLETELLERLLGALDRGDGAAGPRERFAPRPVTLPDPEALLWGPWEAQRPARRRPPPTSSFTRLPEATGLTRRRE